MLLLLRSKAAAQAPIDIVVGDLGQGEEGVFIYVAAGLGESGSGADAFGGSASLPVLEIGSALDAAIVGALLQQSDASSSLDAILAYASLNLEDFGVGASGALAQVLKTVTDFAAGTESFSGVSVDIALSEAGAVSEALLIAALVSVLQAGRGVEAQFRRVSAKIVRVDFKRLSRTAAFSLRSRSAVFSLTH